MTERSFSTDFWGDPFIQELPAEGKLLLAYLKTTPHANQAGLFKITATTISFDTGLARATVENILSSLSPKVEWYPDESLVWVKDFLPEQAKSPKFLTAAISNVKNGRIPEEIADEYLEYNTNLLQRSDVEPQVSLTKRDCVIIRDNFTCQYCRQPLSPFSPPLLYEMDHIIPKSKGGKEKYLNLAATCATCNKKKGDRTPDEAGMPTPNVSTFHAAQAIYSLKNSTLLQAKWREFFPNKPLESMLINVEQRYSTLSQHTPSRARASDLTCSDLNSDLSCSEREEGIAKGGKPISEDATPTSESEKGESLSPGDLEIIATWCSVEGFSMPKGAARDLVARMRTEFADVDILRESKEWAVRKLSEPLTPDSRSSSQLWHWMEKAREINRRPRRSKRRPNERKTYKKCPDCGWKEKTAEDFCPVCRAEGAEVRLEVDYRSGKYGDLVQH